MKSETKKDPDAFVANHSYVENLVIHYKNKTSYFPDIRKAEKGYYKDLFYSELIEEIKNTAFPDTKEDASLRWRGSQKGENQTIAPQDAYFFALNENGGIIYIRLRGEIVFIFECSKGTSGAQIKMEIDDFIDDFQIQGKYRKFFSSIFDW